MEKNVILLVEDDFLNRRLLKKILTGNNYCVLEAKNTQEAMEMLKKECIHLIILDINLGENEQNGIALGQQINDKLCLPFIYVTAYENTEVIDKAISTKPYSYLTKPFKNVDLITAVEIGIRQSGKKHVPKILVKDGEYTIELALDKIYYIISEGNYLLFYTDQKTYKLRSTIKLIMEQLPKNTFVQTHRAYIVNKTKIEKFKQKTIVIKNIEIPVSKRYNWEFN